MKKVLFLTGTRADFGKLKPLIQSCDAAGQFETAVFITGMHTLARYGYTVDEVYRTLPEHRLRDGTRSVYVYHNQVQGEPMERVLANTIEGLSRYVTEFRPDLIVIHGDRVEALAGAIVGALRNILVAHVEGGEVSGTVDELIRHAVTKMSHLHFVANNEACRRLLQLGEIAKTIHVVGSPDIDLMLSESLPDLAEVKRYYDVPFDAYGIAMFHPVTTDLEDTGRSARAMVDALLASGREHVVIYPNNDEGCELIFDAYKQLETCAAIKMLPSMRVEYFLVLLRNARYLVGNSSAGIRECPVFGIPAVNISTRQNGRADAKCIVNVAGQRDAILGAIDQIWRENTRYEPDMQFGAGNSAERFIAALRQPDFWNVSTQKTFNDI
ncbi:UDP-N-acetylglucosamine 2-epimerase (hydrolyzing) [Hyphomicrobium sp. xq]|uniref:UDP-N-acetylglucosamine 2-epimerase (Hydrolyzing) n=1 Tax=Hyphomicrobium album TaxID=2665159 RepID=A0A6I3KJX6_9HYPH|nr:UDP-N-acetylglucosamine 2-epimerase [Hyphomicrobium album]MTD94668.1 UDP-N-acetylglucosamine 2-epimerase (hydrolyzing) [Hyphomicrobium album]